MNNELYPQSTSFKTNSSYRNSSDNCSTFKPMPIAQANNSQLSSKNLLKQKQQLQQQLLRQIKEPNELNKNFLQNNKLRPTSVHNTSLSNSSNQIILNNKINLRSKSPPPVPPQRFSQLTNNKFIDQPDGQSSALWRSKSFAGGLQQQQFKNQQIEEQKSYVEQKAKISLRQAPITYANPNASIQNRNTIHIDNKLDDKILGLNNNNNGPCNQSCCKSNQQINEQQQSNLSTSKGNLNKLNNEISQRYLAAAENNFNAMNGLNKMRHSQSHHSYLSTKAPAQQINSYQTGTLPNSATFHGQLNGQLNPKQPGSLDASSLSSIGSSGSGSLTRSTAFLSQKYASVGNLSQTRKFFGALSLGSKNNRNPQPQRSLLIFASIEKGLRECICLTQEDISQLKNAIGNGVQLSSAQQYKNAERYLKRLEFQLAKIEELRDQYEMHMKMTDGVRSMASAYAFSLGKEKEVALSNARNELKDYIQTMGIVENELEQSMGTLLLQMQGIQGFARLCTGDVFEITIKCGEKQKWKVKGKILKDNVQSWDSTEQIFKPNLTEQLSIKAVELRGLGKKLCLGSKNCEIKDLFSARPQLMSICLNTTGTLKLHLIVTWNPLHEPASKSTLNGFLSNSIAGSSLTGGNTNLTKSKSFTASSTSLFSRFRNSGGSTNNSSTYSTLNLSNPHSYGQSFMTNSALLNKTLNNNKRCTLPGFEIIDAEYYHHPHLLAEVNNRQQLKQQDLSKRITIHGGLPNNMQHSVTRANSMLITPNALKHNNRHSYASGFNHTSLSPIHSPNLRTDENDDLIDDNTINNKKSNINNNKNDNKCQQQQQNKTEIGITPTSTGSRGSSLHLTGTTSSGFGSSNSSSSYCSSVPNSALTSPDNELAPLETTITNNKSTNKERHLNHSISDSNNSSPIECDFSECGHCGNHTNVNTNLNNKNNSKINLNNNQKNSIIVEATVHNIPELQNGNLKNEFSIEEQKQQQIPRSISMPVQLSNNNNNSNNEQKLNNKNQNEQTQNNNRTESTDTLTTPDADYEQIYFNVGDTLINLMSSLEDIQGQYSELHSLHENVLKLYKVLSKISKLRIINLSLKNNAAAINNVKNQSQRVRRSSDASNISVSVESALECFDFLNQTGTDSEVDSVVCTPEHRQIKKEQKQQLQQQQTNNSALNTPCVTPNPNSQSLSSGSTQIDIALMSHIVYSQRLIENLGAFGPLKTREQSSLNKLRLQAQAVERLVRVCDHLRDYLQIEIELRKDKQLKQPMDLAIELEDLNSKFKQQQDLELTSCFGNDLRIAKLWDFVCCLHQMDHDDEELAAQFSQIELSNNSNDKQNISLGNTLLCVTSAGFALCLEKFMQINNLIPTSSMNNTTNGNSLVNSLSISMSNLTGLGFSTTSGTNNLYNTSNKLKGNELTSKISELITRRLIDAPKFETDFVVSLFQLCIFFETENSSLEHLFKSYAQEVQLLHSLASNDAIEIEQSLKQFKKTLPPKEPLNSISLLLLDSDPLIVRIAEAYFLNAAKNKSMRNAILSQLLDALQNDNPLLRQAACLSITLLNGSEYLKHLAFVCTVDPSKEVRDAARQTLLAFGIEGKKLYLESQRFNNGILYQNEGLMKI